MVYDEAEHPIRNIEGDGGQGQERRIVERKGVRFVDRLWRTPAVFVGSYCLF